MMYNKSKSACSKILLLLLIVSCCYCCCMLSLVGATSTDCNDGKTSGSNMNVKRAAATVLDLDDKETELLEANQGVTTTLGGKKKQTVTTTKQITNMSKSRFTGRIGPTNRRIRNRNPYTVVVKQRGWKRKVQCVACRVDCSKVFSFLGSNLFSECKKQYYYYGCQSVLPCYKESGSGLSSFRIQGMISICRLRNGCKLRSRFNFLDVNKPFYKKVKLLSSIIYGVRKSK